MGNRIDLTGRVFGRLIVLGYSHTDKNGWACWNCECSHDGGEKVIKTICGTSLTRKKTPTRSCGCLVKESDNYKNSPDYQKSLNSKPTKNQLRHLYWGLNMSTTQIAAYYKECNPEYAPTAGTVSKWLCQYDIPRRERSMRTKLSWKTNRVSFLASSKLAIKAMHDKRLKGEYEPYYPFRDNPAVHKKALNGAAKTNKAKAKLRHAAAASQQLAHAEMEAILNGETSRF